MKNLMGLLIIAFGLFNTAYGQERDSEALINGLWRIDMEKQKESLSIDTNNRYQILEENQKESLLMTLASRIYFFDKDGSFESSWASEGGPSRIQGLWEFDGKEILTLDIKSVKPLQYRVEFLKKGFALHPTWASESVVETIYLIQID
ncbi:hypothetical protein [Cognataquiflexum aquatile]|uniref:hypothetical protein n=1 Tax=Cognataquiflexum aquatile TaxID=2249427 RepID=UPI000DEBC239|nr:hypothetical protein [Cognataquiflexum aquatile]